MGLFDFLRLRRPSAAGGPQSSEAAEPLFAVPLEARPLTLAPGAVRKTYVFYAFLFGDTADGAVVRLRRELHDEGLEFVELKGKVVATSIPDWTDFVAGNFDWMKDALPTAKQLAEGSRGIVYYSPKITRL
jgi:hypothetical protein